MLSDPVETDLDGGLSLCDLGFERYDCVWKVTLAAEEN